MKTGISIDDIAKFYNEKQELSTLGCDEYEIEKWKKYCQEYYAEKGICLVKEWTVVEVLFSDSETNLLVGLGLKEFVLNANNVLWDSKNRWPPGSVVCSHFLSAIEENCLFITKNTCYVLVGVGHQKSISTALLLSIRSGLSF